nr:MULTISPECIES: glycosyltransferase 87 family protein [Myxococcaceae]
MLRAPSPRLARALLGAGVLLLALHAWGFKAQEDFQVFHTAGARALAGEALYRASDGLMAFKYAPLVALGFGPLGLLPPRAASLVWLLICCGLALRVLALGARLYGGGRSMGREALALLCVLPFLRHHFAVGQCELLLLWLALESERLHAEGRALPAGLLLALACLFKPPFLLLAAAALLLGQGRRLAGLALGLVGGLLAGALRYGWAGNLAELSAWRALLSGSTPGLLCAVDNESAWGMACDWAGAPGSAGFLAVGSGIALLALGALAYGLARLRGAAQAQLLTASALYLTALLSPLGWRTALLGLLPLLFLLLRTRAALAPPAWLPGLALALPVGAALVGALVYDVAGRAAFLYFVGHKLMGLLALLCALLAGGAQVRAHVPHPDPLPEGEGGRVDTLR